MAKSICSVCKKEFEVQNPQDDPNFPFCSEHCRLVDLGRWFTDYYVISQETGALENLSPEDDITE